MPPHPNDNEAHICNWPARHFTTEQRLNMLTGFKSAGLNLSGLANIDSATLAIRRNTNPVWFVQQSTSCLEQSHCKHCLLLHVQTTWHDRRLVCRGSEDSVGYLSCTFPASLFTYFIEYSGLLCLYLDKRASLRCRLPVHQMALCSIGTHSLHLGDG